MNGVKGYYRLLGTVGAVGVLAVITLVAKCTTGINAITIALLYLLVVLAASALVGQACGITVALVSGLLVNYYFLPPFGTLYIAAPEDWVSFVAYVVTALIVGRFAATVQQRANEIRLIETQTAQLLAFAETVLATGNGGMTLETLVNRVRESFRLQYCAIYLYAGDAVAVMPVFAGTHPADFAQAGEGGALGRKTLLEVLAGESTGQRCLRLKDHGETVGVMVIDNTPLVNVVAEQLSACVALALRGG